MLIDCHAHLHVDAFDSDRAQAVARARAAGVEKLINVGFDVEGNFRSLALAQDYEFMYSTMGIHPHCASEWNEEVASEILKTCKIESKIVALGEMGLDYYKTFEPVELQQTVFRAQLRLAKNLGLPVIVHCRDAFADAYEIMDQEGTERALIHCFTGTMKEAEMAWDRGYYTAFTGIITYPSAEALREVARTCPLDKLIVETDCPYLAPQSHRGERNEPAFMVETFEMIKSLRPADAQVLEVSISTNVQVLFGL
ncbi:hydrolase TatD [Candidatus Peregrinibacteria bacterium CG_4_9_14_0_2_um_filter_53_11]|nr:MAG: hydrolase TatD [Candidatus Peregrinibacteria bacterium CG_4_9_14_0_2_um_filter_53_11]